ncbi:alpha/beta fold hydrolase [Promicromonospora thailandica]|uniref:Pimeloyl-ACP methyl ester carboxylesterase n=1 Tax=Promicromonospora thailandica TaxID=765201 RepID=A0A9X2GBV1_9MICO|nr:alpha/beta hydrolase [Promicromonospora thailandica]MCP2266904.1 Pimeloyl-ACP methyl ester carboxylesterase [Promicromonospora thailandica]BFF16572.1 CFTR inhibitory factor Cif [Promicromonospora thailandica]
MSYNKIRGLGVAVLAASALLLPAALSGATPGTDAPEPTRTVAAANASTGSHGTKPDKPAKDVPEIPAGYTSNYANVNGFTMHYLRGGSGSPIVLLHGFPQTSSAWSHQLGPLAEDHTVIAVDLRGTGDSGIPKKGYDTAQMAKDVHALLVKLGLNDGIQVVAHDVGLWVAYPYAAMWPDEVERMAVLDAPLPDDSFFQWPAANADGSPSAWHFGFFQEDPLPELLIGGKEQIFVEGLVTQWLAVDSAFSDDEYEFYADYLAEPGRLTAWMEVYRSLGTSAAQNKAFQAEGLLPMPILAIGGEQAVGAGVGEQWEKYASDVDGRVMEDTGHWIAEERPRELTQILRTFLQ